MVAPPVPVADVLGSLALFADLPRPQLEAIDHTFQEQRFAPDERLLRRGFTGGGFFIVLEGEAVVQLEGTELARLGRGDFFGEVSILLGDLPTADVTAVTAMRCIVLPGPEVQDFLMAYPSVMYRMLQSEARRLRDSLKWRS